MSMMRYTHPYARCCVNSNVGHVAVYSGMALLNRGDATEVNRWLCYWKLAKPIIISNAIQHREFEMSSANRIYLVGAGISLDRPSNVMAAWPLLKMLFRWIAGGENTDYQQLLSAMDPNTYANPYAALRFEAVIQAIQHVVQPPADFLKWIEFFGEPNLCHYCLAQEIADGALVVTVNFDNRIERACSDLSIDPSRFVLSPSHRRPQAHHGLLKIHGTFPLRGRAKPWATLSQIGQAGLGFSRFPAFRRFLREKSKDKHLIVMGYSASDHFDVVPLLENDCFASKISWMDFETSASSARSTPLEQRNNFPVPAAPSVDYATALLADIKGKRPDTQIERVAASSSSVFLSHLGINTDTIAKHVVSDTEKVWSNAEVMSECLDSLELDAQERRDLLEILLDENAFGAHLGHAFIVEEDDPDSQELRSPTNDDPAFSAIEKQRQDLMDQASAEARNGNLREAFLLFMSAVEINAQLGMPAFRVVEMKQMVCEDQFNIALAERQFDQSIEVAQELQRLFQQSGHIIAAIQSLIMRMEVARAQLLWEVHSPKRQAQLISEALSLGELALYYALRAARGEVLATAVLNYAHLLEMISQPEQAYELLNRAEKWFEQGAKHERGSVLLNLGLVALTVKQRAKAAETIDLLENDPFEGWHLQAGALALLRAELCLDGGNSGAALKHLKQAEKETSVFVGTDAMMLEQHIDGLRERIAR